ncbi:MAG: hypothetical protein ACLPN5_21670 [Roseiarcus sp.]
MSRLLAIVVVCAASLVAASAAAQHTHMMDPGASPAMSVADSRELLHFPPMMQTHMLSNMRDHVETLDAIISSVAAGDYAKASKVAKERLGLDSPSAEGCKPQAAGSKTPEPDSMDAMMALYMPAPMRSVGLSMHTSASDFADVAARADATHDTAAVLNALSRITPNCVACHAAYRLR